MKPEWQWQIEKKPIGKSFPPQEVLNYLKGVKK